MSTTAATISQNDVLRLNKFHEHHFPSQNVPGIKPSPTDEPLAQSDLGHYDDGVPRTLTDEQVAMFRHSEVQKLLAERRRQKAQEEKMARRERAQARAREQSSKPSRYANDEDVHSRQEVQELSYDDEVTKQNNDPEQPQQPRTFQWPILGAD